MDKEMMAKVNEILKANGRRELSLDEMEQVVGGADFKYDGTYVYYMGIKETRDEFSSHIFDMAGSFGAGVTIGYLIELTGYNSTDIYNANLTATGLEAQKVLGVVMDRFWKHWDGVLKH